MYVSTTTSILYFVSVSLSFATVASAFDDWNPFEVRDLGDHIPGLIGKDYQDLDNSLLIQDFTNQDARTNQRSNHRVLRRTEKTTEDEYMRALERFTVAPGDHLLTPVEVDKKINEMKSDARNPKDVVEIQALARLYGDRIVNQDAKNHYSAVVRSKKETHEKQYNKLKAAGRKKDAKRFKTAMDNYTDSFGKFYNTWLAGAERKMKKGGKAGEYLTGVGPPRPRKGAFMIWDQRTEHERQAGTSGSTSGGHGGKTSDDHSGAGQSEGRHDAGSGTPSGWKSTRGKRETR
ncbi:hypothetical protein MMC10_004842 [Thelotrema lepadinum]|nr:hypothetical protein [Thelotrema lepadinum]